LIISRKQFNLRKLIWSSYCEKSQIYNYTYSISQDVYPTSIEANLKTKVENEGSSMDKIESVKLTDLNLRITSPSVKDFKFLSSVALYMSAEGLGEKKVAWLDDVPTTIRDAIALITSSADLTDYLVEEVVILRLNTVLNQGISQDYQIGIDVTFLVDAKILGI
jgi:flavin-binding protein dodecin